MKRKIDKKEQEKVGGGYIYDKGLFSNPTKRFQVLDRYGNVEAEFGSKSSAKKYVKNESWLANDKEITLEERDNIIRNDVKNYGYEFEIKKL